METRNMGRISADVTDWRKNRNFSTFASDVDTLFRAGALFTARGFGHSTIKALVLGGIDAPERLLFADEADLRSIPGVDEVALEEIARYRFEFAGLQPTSRPLNALSAVPLAPRAIRQRA
jgi:hypothetical protein